MENLYLEPEGFLGTGASLLADLTLLAYILVFVPAMLVGFFFARQGRHRPHHKYTMIGITFVNWLLIIFLMGVAYNYDIREGIGDQPGNARYLLPTIHAVLGFPAQFLATFIVIRMIREDGQVARAKVRGETSLEKYWFKGAKWTMRVTLGLWFATAMLGIVSYAVRYDVIGTFNLGDGGGEPVATQEVPAPVLTEEVGTEEPPDSDLEPVPTEESSTNTEDVPAPSTTDEP